MLDRRIGAAHVQAERHLSMAAIQVVDIDLYSPLENVLHGESSYRLDLCLTPRRPGTRIRFPQHWGPDRFESAGDLFLLPPREAMQLVSSAGRRRVVICRLLVEPLQRVLDTHLEWTDTRLAASLDVTSLSIKSLLARLGEEICNPGFASDLLTEALALQIAVELQRYYSNVTDRTAPGELALWRLRLIDERLRDGGAPPSVMELAKLCKLSLRQLSRGFRKSRGKSLGEHIAELRLASAKNRLEGGESVKATAYSLGYSSPSGFCQAFRRATGLTPAAFKSRPRLH